MWEESSEGCYMEFIPTKYWKAVSVWVSWKPKRVEIEMWNVSNKKLQCTAGMAMNSEHKWSNFFLWFHKEFFSFVVIAWWWWAISMWEFWFFWLRVLMRNLHGEKFSFTRQCTFHTVLFAYFRTILFALVGFWWIYSEKLWSNWSPWTQFEVILTRKIKIPAIYIPLKIPKKIRSILLSLALMFLIPTPTTMHFSLCVHFTSFYRTRKRIFANGMRGKNCFIYVGDATGVCAWNK